MVRAPHSDGDGKAAFDGANDVGLLPADLDRREIVNNIQAAELALYELKIKGYPKSLKKELKGLEKTIEKLRIYSGVYDITGRDRQVGKVAKNAGIVAGATVAAITTVFSASFTLPLILVGAPAAYAVYRAFISDSTAVSNFKNPEDELEQYYRLSVEVVAKSNIIKNRILELSEFKTKEFLCARDYQICLDGSASSHAGSPLMCALLFVVCMSRFLIPFAGGNK